ncbi:MAG: TonB-dependent receptor [Rhodospirillaceae bacterium]|nr:TonB-dependent receptor [Rhodospirillaceae bacterium]
MDYRNRVQRNRWNALKLGASTFVMVAASLAPSGPTQAGQAAAATPAPIEEIFVTGTSIRGATAPVGSPLEVVGRLDIDKTGAQTVQQIMKTIPSLSNSGALSQGSLVGSSYYAPTIHSLGSSASTSTLVLIDGHRIPLGNTSHPLPDPSIIPTIAIERVEVLADGASSIYGSDAVAGVINFVTRKSYDGLMASAQRGFGDGYHTENANLLWGTGWETANVMLAYGYSFRSPLDANARDFFNPDKRAQGGTNFNSFNCWPATIQPAGSTQIFPSPTSALSVSSATANAMCNTNDFSSAISAERRHTVMVKMSTEFGEQFSAAIDVNYSNRKNHSTNSRGTISATVFQAGAQANPFYINPPGVTATSQTVRVSMDQLLGPGAFDDNKAENYYMTGNVDYDVNEDWRITLFGMSGRDDNISDTIGSVCASCANLGLNGTTNAGGNLTTISVPGTNIIVTTLPLTAANALDVWNVGSANRTSPDILRRLKDNRNFLRAMQTINQVRLNVGGSLFELPGGDVGIAFGGEWVRYTLDADVVRPNNTGPVSTGAALNNYYTYRNVYSAYGEVLVPVIGPGNAMAWAQSFNLNASVRHDKYRIFGGTTNPKFGVDWEVIQGIKVRGSIATSFVAPALTSFGAPGTGLYAGSAYNQYNGQINVPYASYPTARQIPGCPATGDRCIIGTGAIQGINVLSGNQSLIPQSGKSWTVGIDIAPAEFPGRAAFTLFDNKFRNGITSPNAGIAVNTRALNQLLTIYPAGATPAQIAAAVGLVPQTGNLPAVAYFIYDFRQYNVVNINVRGIDAQSEYIFETNAAGAFTVGGNISYFLKFDQFMGDGGEVFSPLGTSGYNQTFASIRAQGRTHFGWELNQITADLFMNYVSSYRNWSANSVVPITQTPAGNPLAGGDRVKPFVTWDFNLAYNIDAGGILGGLQDTQIFVDANNILDRPPPFYNAANGYGPYGANPLGRVVTVGVRARW